MNKNEKQNLKAGTRAIDADELTEELKLILRDYFLGTVTQNGKAIQIKFLNGQKFEITVEQCV